MKVATFNINDINKRLQNLLAWLSKSKPDVVCLQELKAEQGAFPAGSLQALGYEAVWQGERSWNGVAILARHRAPVLTRTCLPGLGRGHAGSLHRSSGERGLDCLYLPSQRQSSARSKIQLQAHLV